MSTSGAGVDTVTRSRRSRVLPDPATLLDLVFVLLLSGLALSGFATSFTGSSFLVVGVIGVVLAILVTHATRALGWPLIAPVVIVAVLFFLLGGPLCLRSAGDTAFLPGGSTLGSLVDQAIFGWKDMLTTLPPVDGDGPLLVLPWLLGLVAGLSGTALSGVRLSRAWVTALLPVLGLTGVLVTVILLGVRHPQSVLVQGSVFAAVALGWLAIRARRASATVHGGSSGWGRVALGAGLVILASALALPASALVTGDDTDRAVARTWVEPPFDIGRYPSPLAGFRKYIDLGTNDDPANVYDKTLFTVQGADGERIRIAAMDTYDGMVWGASNDALPGDADDSFQRVSSTIDNPVEGKEIEVTVTIGEGYDGVWLPTVGALQGVDFRLGDPEAKSESFRYNLATSTAVVPSGVRRGDTYSFTAVQPGDDVTPDMLPSNALSAAASRHRLPQDARRGLGRAGHDADGARPGDCRAPPDRGEVLRRRPQGRAGLPPRPLHPATVRRVRQRPADRRQRRAVRRRDGAARERSRCPRAGRAGGRDPRGRRRHGGAGPGLGRAQGSGRFVADPAHRGVHVHRPPGRGTARDEHADEWHGRAATSADPAAVGRGRAERRRPQGPQGDQGRPGG